MTRVLVVEDEESFSDALSYMLRREGFEVAVCPTGTSPKLMLWGARNLLTAGALAPDSLTLAALPLLPVMVSTEVEDTAWLGV